MRSIREALAGMRRTPLLGGLSITAIGLSLVILGLFGLSAYNIGSAISDVERRVEVVVEGDVGNGLGGAQVLDREVERHRVTRRHRVVGELLRELEQCRLDAQDRHGGVPGAEAGRDGARHVEVVAISGACGHKDGHVERAGRASADAAAAEAQERRDDRTQRATADGHREGGRDFDVGGPRKDLRQAVGEGDTRGICCALVVEGEAQGHLGSRNQGASDELLPQRQRRDLKVVRRRVPGRRDAQNRGRHGAGGVGVSAG